MKSILKHGMTKLALAALLVSLCAQPAMAAVGGSGSYYYLPVKINSSGELRWEYQAAPFMQEFWKYGQMDKLGISPVTGSWGIHIGFDACNLPHQGLVLMNEYDGQNRQDNYITYEEPELLFYDKDGQPFYRSYQGEKVDLNQGRFQYLFDFSDDAYGLAAAVNTKWKAGGSERHVYYIDTNGNIAIRLPEQCHPIYYDGKYYTGRFVNGLAIVFHQNDATDDFMATYTGVQRDPRTLEYAYIDIQGNFVTDWEKASTDEELKQLTSVYNQSSVRLVDVLFPGEYIAPKEPTGPVEPGEPSEPVEPEQLEATYGQASVQIKGYTIDKDYVGKMLVEVTNSSAAPDKGDLFYVVYSKFINGTDFIDAGTYVPNDLILHIPYEVDANSSKTLEIPMGYLPDDDQVLTQDQIAHGWDYAENVESSRTVLAQAETVEEAAELMEFFKRAHDYGEMGLTYQPDSNGVTILAKPMSTIRRAQYLDQKLSAFTSQF